MQRLSRPSTFTPPFAQRLGHYVYSLTDPRNGRLFYVGRGQGNRVLQHAAEALENQKPTDKLETLRAINRAGLQVVVDIVRHGMSEAAAKDVEAAVIDFALHRYGNLANLIRGADVERGLVSLETLLADYDAPPLMPPARPSLLVAINGTWIDSMGEADLWEAARKWWNARRIVQGSNFLLLATAQGIIRGAWNAHYEWDGEVRWDMLDERRRTIYGNTEDTFRPFPARRFAGEPLPPDEGAEFIGRHVRHRNVKLSGPFRYLGAWPANTTLLDPEDGVPSEAFA
ncbi:LEM-3-like GIY-YIG domain-containing protein [Roseomonas sp. 18066]|uniref:LEM-3-like GIY-YIG domain-containing protein n=1 Tax=Roseomonas sp. 18066 TaxID=2681412 RepID=UPI0013585033|nr:hypothetical protein [Roseomonas sp. 18066]